ncbi:hypothetical protein [Nocardia sp. NPDC058666]|uniref:DUF7373 family lipoprotein n=1 Tax=Nocardia sp. NPDC058666 TaxID=3346587 RepID=UPI00365EFD79
MQLVLRVGAVMAAVIMVSACEDPQPPVPAPVSTTTTTATPTTTVRNDEQRLHAGKLAEGARMAEVLTLPTDIDPAFVRAGQTGVLTEPMLTIMTDHNNALGAAATEHGMLTGFVSQRSNGASMRGDISWLTHGILRFPDTEAAQAAATALATTATTQSGMLQSGVWAATGLPDEPDARVLTMDNRGKLEGMAFTPHAEFVVFTKIRAGGGLPEIERTVRAALALQRPALDSFTATPVADLPDLPYDPTGIHALAVGDGSASSGSFGPHGALLFADDQQAAVTLYREVGVSALGRKDSAVYRTADAAAAAKLSAVTAAQIGGQTDWKQAPAPASVPGSACWTDADASRWSCTVSSGPYFALVWAKSQDEAHTLTGQQHTALAAAK